MSELIRDGENGFLVDSLDEAVAAVRDSADARPARRCAPRSKQRFDAKRMVDDYLAVYQRVVALDRARRADDGR